MATEQQADANADKANVESTRREAYDYWGYLIRDDKCGTNMLDRLLKGIAQVISRQFEPTDSPDLTPSQIAAFYRAVDGNYDVLFIETPPSSISFIYRSLGAFHSLQPAADDDGYSTPTVPALKPRGFVTWQTIQLLLGPEEHVPFLQKAVAQFDVLDPETGSVFPKVLPKECFPDRPDDAMETWYEGVAARLKKEAEDDAIEMQQPTRVRVEVDDRQPRTSSDISGESSEDERHAAASYFSDPLYRKSRTRPPLFRHLSKQAPYGEERGTYAVANRVRHMLNPFSKDRRKSSVPGNYESDSYSDDDKTPVAGPTHVNRYPASHKRPHPPRREDSLSTTDSDPDSRSPPSRRRTPVLRHRRSHEPPTSPREYFPQFHEDRRFSHDTTPERREDGPPPLYGPTKSPLFATHVAQLQAHNYYDHRPAMPPRTSYRPHNVRYTVPSNSSSPRERERDSEPPYARDRDRDRDGYDPSSSRHRDRRRSEEHPRRYEVDGRERTRSHDRYKEDWDGRDRSRDSRDRDRDRDRDSGRVRARYVPGVQDGVSGRRYPVEQPWR